MTHRIESGAGWELHLGDCLAILPKIGKVDHCIADPPYEVEAHTKARRSLKDATQKRGASNKGEVRRIDAPLEISFSAITQDDRERVSDLLFDVTARWVVAFCQIEAVAAWRGALTTAGFDWVRGGVWVKPNGAPQFTGDRPGQGFESIAIAHQPGKKRWNGGGKHGVWTVPLDHNAGGGGKADHPTVKPLALMLALVSDFTDAGETILDPFAGSGSTGVACLRLGRRFVGVERDEKFFALACERLRAEERGLSLADHRSGQSSIFDCIGGTT